MVRLLHTADWQMGMKLSGFGEKSERIRDERIAAARRVIATAREHETDFILVAGDLFEDNAVDRSLVQKVADVLGSAHCPVYVVPGNHDPIVPGSVWEHRSWKAASNVTIMTESAPFELPQASIFPCPLREKNSSQDPTAWIHAENDGRVRIGVAHGSVEGAPIGEWDHPIPRNAATRSGLEYLALGHWHSFGVIGDSRTAYSGTHEQTAFGERDSGNVLIVDIEGPGRPPVVTPVRTGGLEWASFDERIASPEDLRALRARVEALGDTDRTLLFVRLSGYLTPAGREEMEHISNIATSRFLWNRIDDSELAPAPGDDLWIEELPPGVLREVARRIRDSGEAREVRMRALVELYALVAEANG